MQPNQQQIDSKTTAPGREASETFVDPRIALDIERVEQILAGSRAHFDEMYEDFFPRVYRFALKRLGDPGEAEDVTQETFLCVFRSLGSYRGGAPLLIWVFGIARNTVNRRFRRARPQLESTEAEGASELVGSEVPPDRAVEARRLLKACEDVVEHEFSPTQRRIFHLKHLRRQPIREIALALGKSEDAIKANLYRMRRSILASAPGLDALLREAH
ncbi:MAG: RNA polymerase sigma factor [Myxococcales bacterium]|nr:RNA polymerase sigma factor [Myxococcales bacterium]